LSERLRKFDIRAFELEVNHGVPNLSGLLFSEGTLGTGGLAPRVNEFKHIVLPKLAIFHEALVGQGPNTLAVLICGER